jgi:hypothetical protein
MEPIGRTMMKGLIARSEWMSRNGDAATFVCDLLAKTTNGTFDVDVEHKNVADTTATSAGTYADHGDRDRDEAPDGAEGAGAVQVHIGRHGRLGLDPLPHAADRVGGQLTWLSRLGSTATRRWKPAVRWSAAR